MASSDLIHVGSDVTVLGRLLPAPSRLHGFPEEVDLATDVIEVVLPLDVVSGEYEQPRNGVAVCSVPTVTDRERPGGIG